MSKIWFGPYVAAGMAVMSAFGTIMQGQQASASANAQASMYRDAASATQLEESRARNDLDIQRQRTLSTAKATMAAQGGDIDQGIVSAQAAQFGDQDERIKNDSMLKQRNMYARSAYTIAQGDFARIGSYFKAGGQLLGGASNFFKPGGI